MSYRLNGEKVKNIMSMKDYAVDDYGIVLTEKDIPFIEEVSGEKDLELYEIGEVIEVEHVSEFTGEVFRVKEDGTIDYDNHDLPSFDSDELVYFGIPKWGSLFHPAYNNMNEFVDDMKNSYGKWLPENYDYKNHIFKISGTYYG
jgi:hypothetical protein